MHALALFLSATLSLLQGVRVLVLRELADAALDQKYGLQIAWYSLQMMVLEALSRALRWLVGRL